MYNQEEKSTVKSSNMDASKLIEMNLQQHHERCLVLHPRPCFVVERAPDFGEVREVLHALSRRVEPEIHVTNIARRLATLYCLSFLEELPFLHRHRTERGDVHGQHERAQDAVRPAHILRTLNSTQSDRTSGSLTRPSAQHLHRFQRHLQVEGVCPRLFGARRLACHFFLEKADCLREQRRTRLLCGDSAMRTHI